MAAVARCVAHFMLGTLVIVGMILGSHLDGWRTEAILVIVDGLAHPHAWEPVDPAFLP